MFHTIQRIVTMPIYGKEAKEGNCIVWEHQYGCRDVMLNRFILYAACGVVKVADPCILLNLIALRMEVCHEYCNMLEKEKKVLSNNRF